MVLKQKEEETKVLTRRQRRERRENDSGYNIERGKTSIQTSIQTTTTTTTTTTTPFSLSLEDIHIERGFVDTFSRRKGFGERSDLVLDSDISS